jgi:acetyl esterase/lipase
MSVRLRSRRPRSRLARAAGILAPLLVLAVALGLVAAAPDPVIAQARPSTPRVTTWEYLPGVEADLYLPARGRFRPVPLVVMIPGGGWQTADRTGLGQLAEALRAEGVAVTNATYRIGTEASRFPVPPQDVACAVDASVAVVRRAGFHPGPIVLLGHSAGAHLSSLAAFGGSEFRSPQCRHPRARVDGWIGLSGIYDLTLVGQYAWTMMGATAEEAPELYARAATHTYLATGGRTHIDALVVHGDADGLIPPFVGSDFAALLESRGYETQLTIAPGADHLATFQASVVGETILTWLDQVERRR